MKQTDAKWYDEQYSKKFNKLTCWNDKILEIIKKEFDKREISINLLSTALRNSGESFWP